jgi:hypothetical protein
MVNNSFIYLFDVMTAISPIQKDVAASRIGQFRRGVEYDITVCGLRCKYSNR